MTKAGHLPDQLFAPTWSISRATALHAFARSMQNVPVDSGLFLFYINVLQGNTTKAYVATVHMLSHQHLPITNRDAARTAHMHVHTDVPHVLPRSTC
jgi:hypothetical protein